MRDRSYTLKEIDRMRALIMHISYCNAGSEFYPGAGFAGSSEQHAIVRTDTEDKLRTYMTAGIDLAELEAEARDASRRRNIQHPELKV